MRAVFNFPELEKLNLSDELEEEEEKKQIDDTLMDKAQPKPDTAFKKTITTDANGLPRIRFQPIGNLTSLPESPTKGAADEQKLGKKSSELDED